MKKILLLLLFPYALAGQSFAAIYDVAKQNSITGKDTYYNNAMHATAVNWCVSHSGIDTIYFDSTKTWHITQGNNGGGSDMYMMSANGKKNIVVDDSYTGDPSLPVFIWYGNSNYGFIGISCTGIDNRKHIAAFVQCNSYGATGNQANTNISFINCDFSNLWADDVIRMGNTGGGLHTNDNVLFDRCTFTDIFNPLHPVLHADGEVYGSSAVSCDAISNEQTTLREEVKNCSFTRISGRAGAGYGWTLNPADTIASNPFYGNWHWHNNTFNHCYKFLEFNGGPLMRGVTVTDNYGFDWTSDNGHATSITGYQTTEVRNKWIGFDRSGCERYGIENKFRDSIIIRRWTAGCGGTPVVKQFAIHAMEVAGYCDTVSDYVEFQGYTQADKMRLMPCLLTGKGVETDHQPTWWKGQFNAGMIAFDGFKAVGGNAPFVGAEVFINNIPHFFDNVLIKANCSYITSLQRELVVEQLGYNWRVAGFYCNLTGSPAPDIISGLYGFNMYQPAGASGSKVGRIRLYDSTWDVWRRSSDYSYQPPRITGQ